MSEGKSKSALPILFVDFDGTLCHDHFWRSLPTAHQEPLQDLLFRGDFARVNDWMLGKYSSEEINHYVAQALGIPYAELWALFVKDCRTMRVDAEVLARLNALRACYRVILITGNMDCFSRFVAPALGLDGFVDLISNSCQEGRHKTDDGGAIFSDYATSFQVPIGQCVLIDDSAAACEIFDELGGQTCLISQGRDVGHYLSILEQDVA